jgi:hypothetical protein
VGFRGHEVHECAREWVRKMSAHTFRSTRKLLPSSVNSGYIQAYINNLMVNKWVNINSVIP